ncbi:MAG: inositol monophosphatase family protein [Acidimicrobiales bacterium]
MDEVDLVNLGELLREAAAGVRHALDGLADWGPSPGATHPGQYRCDVAADSVAVEVLLGGGLGVLSEESGLHRPERELLAVLDPVDGSTNASRGIPWYATSICVLDARGALAALVVNQATGERFEAIRGGGATRDGSTVRPSDSRGLNLAMVGVSGWAPRRIGWRQHRALGAAALDLCAVACGRLDAYLDCGTDVHGPWDYLAGMLVCTEAGAVVLDAQDRPLVTRGHGDRRTPLAAATPELMAELRSVRATFP